ncbi:secretin N-terminal domain-containing protein [Caballeronia sp. LP003]|uniref:type II secretion system protein GspD n=1 Tax=Caballeronia sp. LP003 TaxID=3038551 RepID=UPI00285DE760|nr:secretin N-terminal domain-containing protein [Caballeronia sp. LP003]MDR5791730.1 secretin N-terminal domain-containing protein [Caballeronia sp. LP003]
MNARKTIRSATVLTVIASMLSACGVTEINREQSSIGDDAKASYETAPRSRPIVRVHEGSLLMGEKVRASKPQPEIFDKPVEFREKRALTLSEIATWIAETIHVRAQVDASAESSVQANANTPTVAAPMAIPFGRSGGPLPMSGIGATPDLSAALPGANVSANSPSSGSLAATPFRYTGSFAGFLKTVEAQYNVYSRYRDGVVTFFRTETRTFTVPTLPDMSSMSGSITTGDSNGSAANGSQGLGMSSASSASGSGSSGSGSGGQTMSLQLHVSPWETLKETGAAIAGPGATVVADKNLGVLTVTGSPPQCDRVEQWMKSLSAMYGKQVAIDVRVYQVQITHEENYALQLSLAYQGANGHTGIKMTGAQAPTITSSSTPMTFGASILGGTLAGTSAAVQALSTLGNVTQVVARSGVTQNGKMLALQAAKSQGYVQSTSTTLAASVGSSTSIQTGTLVPGFTSSFIPKVVDGRILIDFDMTLSDLIRLDTFTSGTGTSQSSVQLPLEQITRFQQSISLRPNESLVLTGMRQQTTSTTNNGVGAPWMPLLGGGVDAQKGDTIISVVISARLL